MSENLENQVEETTEATEEAPVDTTEAPKDAPADDIEAIVAERLAKMKANMDRMAKERDDALKAKAEIEKAKKDAEIARMKEEGKLQEALEMELAEARAKLELFEKETTSLKRDGVVNDALAGLDFRSDKSREMARREIVDSLVQNEEGQWVHTSGTSIKDFVEAYSKSEDNSFLFRVKANSGAGTNAPAGAPSTEATKSIGQLTTQEILALAAKGQLGNFGY
jgi:NADH dehydrogenase/NADH:ubiquinone oxidoreductase subunit G